MKWLHLSDIHFNIAGYNNKVLKEKLVEKLQELNLDLDFILITGDCLYRYEEGDKEIDSLAQYIKDIAKKCRCKNSNIYICQGNHDVSRQEQGRLDKITKIRKGEKNIEIYSTLNQLANEKFRILYKKITGRAYESYKVFADKDKPYRIISINTSLLSMDKKDKGKLIVCTEKLGEIGKLIKNDNKLNILIMHHGTDWLKEDDERKFIHWMDDNNVDVVFNGHTHLSAALTYDDTYRNLMQFTAGAIVQDGYAIPGFYLCNYEDKYIVMEMYAFSKDTESWEVGNHYLRKFKNGKYEYKVVRFALKSEYEINIEKLKECFSTYNNAYFKKFNTDKIYANKNSGYEKFDSWKIMHSLVEIGVPYDRAIDLTNNVICQITNENSKEKEKFEPEDISMSCSELRNIIYDTIRNCQIKNTESEFEISCWASRYARRYNRNEEILVLKEYSNTDKLNYHFIKEILLKECLDDVTGNTIYYEKLTRKEVESMANSILGFLNNLGIFEIKKDVLKELVKEFITQKPHPWVINNKSRNSIVDYHINQAREHINDLQKRKNKKNNSILQIEATYHICAAILSHYDNYIGSTELSPLKILLKSINCMYIDEGQYKGTLPMQLFQVIQLKKDIESFDGSFDEFTRLLDVIYYDVVKKQRTTLETTRDALIKLWDYLLKLKEKIGESYTDEIKNAKCSEKIRYIFCNARGFIVKSNLRGLENAFWVNPYWEKHEIEQQNLHEQVLVCILERARVDLSLKKICDYLALKKCSSREIVFVMDDCNNFTSDERTIIRNYLKKNGLQTRRCIFIQESNFEEINVKGWRKILYDIVCISRYS